MEDSSPATDVGRRRPPPSLVLVWLGAATASWDVVGVDLVGRTLKINTVLFGLAIGLRLPAVMRRRQVPTIPARLRWPILAAVLLLTWMGARSLATDDLRSSIAGFAAQLIPSTIPIVAILLHRADVRSVVRAFVIGMAAASAIAIVEYVARSNDWGWVTSYRATVDGRPRSAAFAFEAAYLAAPLVAALVITAVWWQRGVVKTVLGATLLIGLISTNARIVVVQIAVIAVGFAVLALVLDPLERKRVRRGLLACAVVGIVAGLSLLVVRPSTFETAADRVSSIFDVDEPTSNSPRLERFEEIGEIIADHPIVGIGPGRLGDELRERGYAQNEGADDASFVTNNVWTQALVDGGIVALLVQAVFVGSALATLRRSTALVDAVVLLAWASILLGVGLTVSNFWDVEPWVLFACALTLAAQPSVVVAPEIDDVSSDTTSRRSAP